MNLYEIKNADTGQIMAPAILASEAAELLNCPLYAISNAHRGNYAIYSKYRVNQTDSTITKQDPIWLEWDLWRTTILRACRRTRK